MVDLVTLGESSSVNSSCCSAQLVRDICQGLLHPSVPLSAAAARKLQLQLAGANATVPRAGSLLRSLPVELLYDDLGLNLFEQITQLPEYYLTAAEADILAASGPDIVDSCVAEEGALLVELGAGSMRKTRLLLDAVLASGRQGVTFCALDLCQQSLADALEALQGVYQGSIQLVGLVGTYQQGLAHLQQQLQAQHFIPNSGGHTKKPVSSVNELVRGGSHSGSCLSSCSGSDQPLMLQMPTLQNLLLSAASSTDISDDDVPAAAPDNSSRSSSSNLPGAATAPRLLHHSSGSSSGTDWCVELSPNTAAPAGELFQSPDAAAHHTAADAVPQLSAVDPAPRKVIMWLGSSIGNSSKSKAAAFLRQLREATMQPGDVLLVGVDRRNSPAKVEAAYNDAAGVTRSFILNGLTHCKRLLDGQLAAQETGRNGSSGNSSSSCKTNISSCGSSTSSSLDPAAFSYFCVYNEEWGRHEAYYQASRATHILLPAAVEAGQAGQGACLQANTAGDGKIAGGSVGNLGDSRLVDVAVAEGELVHIEFSHKYSRQDVTNLAAAAGLAWVKAWSDSQQQYDLHMFTCNDVCTHCANPKPEQNNQQ